MPFGCIDVDTTNIWKNPKLAKPAEGDFHLLPSSPAIDAGDPDADFSQEPSCGGDNARMNAGVYGGTNEATCGESNSAGRSVRKLPKCDAGPPQIYNLRGRKLTRKEYSGGSKVNGVYILQRDNLNVVGIRWE
jgi:hypothetical protein